MKVNVKGGCQNRLANSLRNPTVGMIEKIIVCHIKGKLMVLDGEKRTEYCKGLLETPEYIQDLGELTPQAAFDYMKALAHVKQKELSVAERLDYYNAQAEKLLSLGVHKDDVIANLADLFDVTESWIRQNVGDEHKQMEHDGSKEREYAPDEPESGEPQVTCGSDQEPKAERKYYEHQSMTLIQDAAIEYGWIVANGGLALNVLETYIERLGVLDFKELVDAIKKAVKSGKPESAITTERNQFSKNWKD